MGMPYPVQLTNPKYAHDNHTDHNLQRHSGSRSRLDVADKTNSMYQTSATSEKICDSCCPAVQQMLTPSIGHVGGHAILAVQPCQLCDAVLGTILVVKHHKDDIANNNKECSQHAAGRDFLFQDQHDKNQVADELHRAQPSQQGL